MNIQTKQTQYIYFLREIEYFYAKISFPTFRLWASPDEGYSRNVPDEGYSRNVPDEGYSRNVPDEGYSRNVPDEVYSRNESYALNLRSTILLFYNKWWYLKLEIKYKIKKYSFQTKCPVVKGVHKWMAHSTLKTRRHIS